VARNAKWMAPEWHTKAQRISELAGQIGVPEWGAWAGVPKKVNDWRKQHLQFAFYSL
jgi:hypothetical protein